MELTLQTYLEALLAEKNEASRGWYERAPYASTATLEETIAPLFSGRSAAPKWLECHALAMRYRRLLDELIRLFGGTALVYEHLCSLQRCRAEGKLPEPATDSSVAGEAAAMLWELIGAEYETLDTI